jgi:hypothetical protein
MYHKTQVTVSARVSLASHHSLRLVGGVVKKGLGRAVASNQDSPVSHSAIDPLPLFVCDLSAVPPPRRRALSNSILWISLPTPLLPPPQKHLSLREQASSTNKQPPRLLHHHHHLSALTPSLLCRLPDAGPGRRQPRGITLDQRNTTKRSSTRHPRARCRYRASRHSPLQEIAVPPDLQSTTGKPKRKDLQHRTSPPTHIF